MSEDPVRVFEEGPDERLRAYYERMSRPRPVRPRSKAEWLDRRPLLRQKTFQALGLTPMPDRLPLEVRQGGTLERDGYRVERLYWQTWPGVWASGRLYLPARLEGRAPAILSPHGHWENGARHPTVQSRLISLAKLGYVVLCPDSVHLYDYATGVTPLTAMTFNNLRALEYLQSRPEVDRDRIGATGASGGAQQTMYLLALDDRIRVAVLAVMPTYYQRILSMDRNHCACNHVPGMLRFTDEQELAAVAAPKAVLYLTVTGDWTAEFPNHELGELRALYRLWGQEDRLGHRQYPGEHDYNREMREYAYLWFERELRGNRSAESVPEPEHEVESLETLQSLDAAPPEDRGSAGILEWYRKRAVAQPPQLESKQSRRSYQERVRGEVRELLGGDTEAVALAAEEGRPGVRAFRCSGVQALRVDAVDGSVGPDGLDGCDQATRPPGHQATHHSPLTLQTEPDVRIPAVWLPGNAEGRRPVLVALHPEGKGKAVQSQLVRGLAEAGWAVLAPDVRLRGEMRREWLHNSLLWGRPEAGMAVTDVQACIDWLWGREEVDERAIVLLGEGDQGVAALLAAGLDERIAGVVADCVGTTYRDGGEGLPVIPNLLRVADLPQIASLAAPRPAWLFNVPGERVGFSSRRYYDWTRRTFQSLGEQESLQLSKAGLPDGPSLAEWLEKRLKRARRL